MFYSSYERIFKSEINNPDSKDNINVENLKKVAYRNFDIASKSVTDTFGNSYDVRNTFIAEASYLEGMGYAVYYTGKHYDTISGTLAYLSDNEYDIDGIVKINTKTSNGNRVRVYESPQINNHTIPFKFETNIAESNFIRISYTTSDQKTEARTYSCVDISKVTLQNFK